MSFSPESDKIFAPLLQPSEKVLWTGRPNPNEAAKRTIPLVLFGTIWTGMVAIMTGVGVWGSIAGKFGVFGLFFVLFTLPFLGIGVLLLTSPLWTKKQAKVTYYAITDQRAIIVDTGKKGTTQSYNLSELGPPYVVGGRKCPDLHWSLQPQSNGQIQTSAQSSSLARGVSVSYSTSSFGTGTSNSTGTSPSTGFNNRSQATRFEFTCLDDAMVAFDAANKQSMLIERQKEKDDPLHLDQLKTMWSGGKLYVYSGLEMYEFDGTRATNPKNIAKYAGFVVGPIILCMIIIFALNFATSIVNAHGGGIFNLFQPAIFFIFGAVAIFNMIRSGRYKQVVASVGAPVVDFSNSKVIERLQQIYSTRNLVIGGQAQERGFLSKLVGYVVGIVLLGVFGSMLLVPMWASYQELQEAIQHPAQSRTEETPAEGIEGDRKKVARDEKELKEATTPKRQRELRYRLALNRDRLAYTLIEQGNPAEASKLIAQTFAERLKQLGESYNQLTYEKPFPNLTWDAIWYSDCLRDLKKPDEANAVSKQLIAQIDKTAKAKKLDPLVEKKTLIDLMVLSVKNAGYEKPATAAREKLKQLQSASAQEKNAGYNKLIETLLDSMH